MIIQRKKIPKIFSYLIIFCLLFLSLPANAVKWENFGFGVGIYLDMDSISEQNNKVSVVYKFTNESMLKIFSLLDQKQRPLSVCLMQTTVDCSTGKPVSGAMLCYDKASNVAIDEPNMDFSKSNRYNPATCSELRELKKMMK